jgi:hypothetical protein
MSFYNRGFQKFKNIQIVPGGKVMGLHGEYPGQYVFYVDDTVGSDSNDGLSVLTPFLTTEYAISQCVANRYDCIVVMQRSPSTHTTGEAWPIDVDKQGILLTGLYSRGLISDSGFGPDAIDTNCITIAANHCAVENLYLQVHSGGTTGNVISTDAASVYGFTLRNCWLALQNTTLYGFYTGASADWPYLLIEDCTFGVPNASNYTSAIKLFNASFGKIQRNVFYPGSSYIIDIGTQCGNVAILDNKFKCASDTDGFAIYARTGSSDNFITGNQACFGGTTATNHPFFDAGGTANDWGWNTEQEHIVLPDAT